MFNRDVIPNLSQSSEQVWRFDYTIYLIGDIGTLDKYIRGNNHTLAKWYYAYYDDDDNNVYAMIHRDNGPAIQDLDDVNIFGWFQYNKLHREDGPAFNGLYWNNDGIPKYYLMGHRLRKDDHEKIMHISKMIRNHWYFDVMIEHERVMNEMLKNNINIF